MAKMKKWNSYTSNEIRPKGWLRRQLEIQAAGLNGNLDKVWRDIRDSAWIGGDAEGWERVPYWLDGFIPLAYLLQDEDMIRRAKKYISAITANQKEDGWICPCKEEERKGYDTWAVLLISKTLTVYYECSKDETIIPVIYKLIKNYYELLKKGDIHLFEWGKYRWFEGFAAIQFLYERFPEEWLKELAAILKEQGVDYADKTECWKRPLYRWTFDTHIVNMTMMLKEEAVTCDILGLPYTDKAEQLREILDRYNGTPVGLFTGDECLAGLSPIQGTELCAVAEQMYSYELLYAYAGDSKWAERLEMLAFNALPAAISDDMWTHQYDQQSNQINCIKFPGKSLFGTNGPEAHLFGLEPTYGCCTANFGQAWPKFALSAFLHSGSTVLNAVPVPAKLKTEDFSVELETNYPFENTFLYKVETNKDMELMIRIPSFAQNLRINETASDLAEKLVFKVKEGEKREIRISFDTKAKFVRRPYDLVCVQAGSLVFSVPIKNRKVMHEYVADGVERKYPYCDYELVGESEWRYGYCDEDLTVEYGRMCEVPFSSEEPAVVVRAQVQKIAWDYETGYETVCAKTPITPVTVTEGPEEVCLYPYGCAKLRMTELPLVR